MPSHAAGHRLPIDDKKRGRVIHHIDRWIIKGRHRIPPQCTTHAKGRHDALKLPEQSWIGKDPEKIGHTRGQIVVHLNLYRGLGNQDGRPAGERLNVSAVGNCLQNGDDPASVNRLAAIVPQGRADH
jgi:hypothetical protein